MAGPNDEIRRIDLFAAMMMASFHINPRIHSALEVYSHEQGYDQFEKAQFLSRIAYNTAEIMQAESETRITTP